MDREFFVKLTYGVHRVANALPEEEGIARSLKDISNELLLDLMTVGRDKDVVPKALSGIEALERSLVRARENHWVEDVNFMILEQEYGKIRKLLETLSARSIPVEPERSLTQQDTPSLSERQKKILSVLQTKQKIQVWELQKVLPEVTKRTLRRDLDELLQLELIERQGQWNAIFYQLRGQTNSIQA